MFFILLLVSSQAGFSQVAINTSGLIADPSAILDVYATDKGLLIPRVSLNGIADNTYPVNNPAIGLLVFNMEGNDLTPGIYIWNGMNWASLPTMEEVQNALPGPTGSNVFGEMFEYNAIGSYSIISIPANGTYIAWNTATLGNISGMSFNDASSTLIAENSGIYSVAFNAVIQLPTGGKIVDVALFVNETRQDDLHGRAWINEADKPQDISFSGIITLYADDIVGIRYTTDHNGTIRVEIANLSLTKID